jgi:hypothetical protein
MFNILNNLHMLAYIEVCRDTHTHTKGQNNCWIPKKWCKQVAQLLRRQYLEADDRFYQVYGISAQHWGIKIPTEWKESRKTFLISSTNIFLSTLGPQQISLLKGMWAGCPWLTPIILATQEAEIRKIMVWSQPDK